MNDLTMVVTGWVATDPKMVLTREENGTDMCSFRVAQTSRYFDRSKQEWADSGTEWFTVRVFRDSAWSVRKSIHKGQPVIVEGRFRTHEWTDANKEKHVDLQLDASCVGHDLMRGVADFTRTVMADEAPAGADTEDSPELDDAAMAEELDEDALEERPAVLA